jgi:hypothetical protein
MFATMDFRTDATLLKNFQFGDNGACHLETRIGATRVFTTHPTYGIPRQHAIDADPDSPTFA